MKLQEQCTLDTNKCCSLTKGYKRILLPTTAAPTMGIWLLQRQLSLLLLLLLSDLQRPTASSEVAAKRYIDLSPDSFDDQYQGCGQEIMEELNQGDYFSKELETHRNYSKVWQNAHVNWLNQEKGLPENMTITHAVALLVYTLNNNVRSDFTRAMASAGRSPEQYKHSFHFKYLHYYLTSAVQLLRKEIIMKNDSLCYKVYYKAKDVYLEVSIGATLRFGQFLSTSLLREEAQNLENQTLFTIFTCLGVPVQHFSLKEVVLVPPYELFEVVNMSYHPKGTWLQLHSTGNFSTYNCLLLKASSKKCIPAPIVIAFLSFLTSFIILPKSGI
ncbi:PREDICTED: ecto-ADP-ribosyltransferase 4 [Condylura cristata]|uniref:ecto-ADP-ribosyltransferase 4 n=1 Tax=Condylura cristata TaxID=143302 RepID=UPI00033462E4|nr:PREDICTED: ecto-ADP-ribosyltransferase 4 [Condylura cristata]